MEGSRYPPPTTLLRIGLVAFIVLWIFGPYELRAAVPIWIPFAVALGLELNFLVGALRDTGSSAPDRGPQQVDRDRYGYNGETEEDLDDLFADPEKDEDDDAPAPERAQGLTRAATALRRFAVGVGVLGALALAIWFIESRTGWDSLSQDTRAAAVERFSQEASRIAEKPVDIRCDESRSYVGAVQHADGVALVGGDRAYLTPERCYDLYRLAFEGETTFSQTARAIAVLAHEAWHLRGVSDEGTTECYALQSGVALGQTLGLSEDTARDMMRQQLAENALRGAGSAEYRLTADCRDGGRLDLDATSSTFP